MPIQQYRWDTWMDVTMLRDKYYMDKYNDCSKHIHIKRVIMAHQKNVLKNAIAHMVGPTSIYISKHAIAYFFLRHT